MVVAKRIVTVNGQRSVQHRQRIQLRNRGSQCGVGCSISLRERADNILCSGERGRRSEREMKKRDVKHCAVAVDDAQTNQNESVAPVQQVLAGLTTTLSMIPESLAFTFVAGVPPLCGLHAAAIMAFMTSVFGSQHGVISGAAGATAVVLAPLSAQHGIEYLFAAVLLSGVLQCAAGVMRLGKFIRLVPQPVMMGFVNGLALVIGASQLEQFRVHSGSGWLTGVPLMTMSLLTVLTMVIIKVWPAKRLRIPGPLAAISLVTMLVKACGIATKTVGDMASIAGSFPSFHLPIVPVNLTTLSIILPTACSVAAVGLIETLLTQQLVDAVTETRSETHVECIGQGIGNIANGVLGGMGGCAMIGQSMINVNAGGRNRLSGISCAVFIMLSVIAGSAIIEAIPLAALVGTMWMLVWDIFDKSTFRRAFSSQGRVPKTETFVVALTTAFTVAFNLAIAVAAGVVVSCLSFAWKSAQKISARREREPDAYQGKSATVLKFDGPLFFGSVMTFKSIVGSPKAESEDVLVLDFLDSRIWDSSALEAVSEVVALFQSAGKEIHLRHLSRDCSKLLSKAGDLYSDLNVIERDADEDPTYSVLLETDYPVEVLSTDYDNRLSSALKRQYSQSQ